MQADIKVKFRIGENPAKNFGRIITNLIDVADKNVMPVPEVIDAFIEDLENYNREDYDKNLENIELKGLTPDLLASFIDYLKKTKKVYEQKVRQDKKSKGKETINIILDKIEKEIDEAILNGKSEIDEIERKELDIKQDNSLSSKEKKSILKKLAERKMNVEVRETAREQAKQAMEKIQKVVDREFAEGNIESRAMYLKSIQDEVENTDKVEGEAKKYLLEMIKDEIYYEQVREFTAGFEFLRKFPEAINAINGYGFTGKKFTDREAYDRFCDLRTKLQDGVSEYSQVNRILEDGGINDTDKRILEARKSVMDKEMEKRREVEVR